MTRGLDSEDMRYAMTVDHFDTLLAHDPEIASGPVVPPIAQTSLFAFDSFKSLKQAFTGEQPKPIYSRGRNPTVQAFEQKLALLEGAEAARGFASGMGAISAAILSQVRAGEKIVCVRHVYPDTYRLLVRLLPRFGIESAFVDGRDAQAIERGLDGARLLYLESPTSLTFERQDLARLAASARAAGAISIADNSWASPILQRPLELGVDLVVHSASKYLGGHSDVVAGVVAGSADLLGRIEHLTYPFLGAKLSPFDAWLLLRGMRTLAMRMERHGASALTIARWLEGRPEVAAVHHPALQEGSGGAPCSGLFSVELAETVDIPAFCDALSLFRLGVSWGGFESLAFPAMIGLQQAGDENALKAFGVSKRLVRLSIGLESADDLTGDLEQALQKAV